jgi:hypothetical protein
MGTCTKTKLMLHGIRVGGVQIVMGIYTVTLSTSYASGGDTLDLSDDFSLVYEVSPEPVTASHLLRGIRGTNGDPATCKVQAFTAVGTEATTGANLSGVTVICKVIGV